MNERIVTLDCDSDGCTSHKNFVYLCPDIFFTSSWTNPTARRRETGGNNIHRSADNSDLCTSFVYTVYRSSATATCDRVAVATRDRDKSRENVLVLRVFVSLHLCCARHDVAVKSYSNNINPDVGHRIAPM